MHDTEEIQLSLCIAHDQASMHMQLMQWMAPGARIDPHATTTAGPGMPALPPSWQLLLEDGSRVGPADLSDMPFEDLSEQEQQQVAEQLCWSCMRGAERSGSSAALTVQQVGRRHRHVLSCHPCNG